MEFKFPINEFFKQPVVEINSNLLPPGFSGDRRALWDAVGKVSEVINAMGEASAAAQGLSKPITTAERLRNSEHKIYFLIDQGANNGKGAITGMLKIGKKGLYVFDRNGEHHQVSPNCILDFYVHESRQRTGLGKRLFEHMLEKEDLVPVKIAIDRPSEKFLGFLNKHYGLNNPVKQMNNYVVFDGFFSDSSDKNGAIENNNSVGKKQTANGLQTTYGRYGAPRPPCSMGQIIHNQSSTVQKTSESIGNLMHYQDPNESNSNSNNITQTNQQAYNYYPNQQEFYQNLQQRSQIFDNVQQLSNQNQTNHQVYSNALTNQNYSTNNNNLHLNSNTMQQSSNQNFQYITNNNTLQNNPCNQFSKEYIPQPNMASVQQVANNYIPNNQQGVIQPNSNSYIQSSLYRTPSHSLINDYNYQTVQYQSLSQPQNSNPSGTVQPQNIPQQIMQPQTIPQQIRQQQNIPLEQPNVNQPQNICHYEGQQLQNIQPQLQNTFQQYQQQYYPPQSYTSDKSQMLGQTILPQQQQESNVPVPMQYNQPQNNVPYSAHKSQPQYSYQNKNIPTPTQKITPQNTSINLQQSQSNIQYRNMPETYNQYAQYPQFTNQPIPSTQNINQEYVCPNKPDNYYQYNQPVPKYTRTNDLMLVDTSNLRQNIPAHQQYITPGIYNVPKSDTIINNTQSKQLVPMQHLQNRNQQLHTNLSSQTIVPVQKTISYPNQDINQEIVSSEPIMRTSQPQILNTKSNQEYNQLSDEVKQQNEFVKQYPVNHYDGRGDMSVNEGVPEYGYPPQIPQIDTQEKNSSSPKLERPRSLSIQLSEDQPDENNANDIESEVPAIVEVIEKIETTNVVEEINVNDNNIIDEEKNENLTVEDNKSTGKRTPSHLTEQGFFDLKFYHNKLW